MFCLSCVHSIAIITLIVTDFVSFVFAGTDSEKAKEDYVNNVKELIASIGLKE